MLNSPCSETLVENKTVSRHTQISQKLNIAIIVPFFQNASIHMFIREEKSIFRYMIKCRICISRL